MIASMYFIIFMTCGVPTHIEAGIADQVLKLKVQQFMYHSGGKDFDMFFSGSYEGNDLYELIVDTMKLNGIKQEKRDNCEDPKEGYL